MACPTYRGRKPPKGLPKGLLPGGRALGLAAIAGVFTPMATTSPSFKPRHRCGPRTTLVQSEDLTPSFSKGGPSAEEGGPFRNKRYNVTLTLKSNKTPFQKVTQRLHVTDQMLQTLS